MITTNLITRTDPDVPDGSVLYGPGWHAEVPDVLKPGMVAKIGIRGNMAQEWPWATIRRVLDRKVFLVVERTVHADDHGVESGMEVVGRRDHLHLVVDDEGDKPHVVTMKKAEIEELGLILQRFQQQVELLHDDVDRCRALQESPAARQLAVWELQLATLEEIATCFTIRFFLDVLRELKPLRKAG